MDTRLRNAEPEDAPRIGELLEQLGWTVAPTAVVAELSSPTPTEVVVAENDAGVVGLIAIASRRQLHRAGPMITVDTLVVDEHHRSQGVGELLMQAAFDAAIRDGAHAIELASHLRRVDARRFYERLGFEVAANYFVRELGSPAPAM